jgi:hypothetical protein
MSFALDFRPGIGSRRPTSSVRTAVLRGNGGGGEPPGQIIDGDFKLEGMLLVSGAHDRDSSAGVTESARLPPDAPVEWNKPISCDHDTRQHLVAPAESANQKDLEKQAAVYTSYFCDDGAALTLGQGAVFPFVTLTRIVVTIDD